jgi:hypothetical protein
LTSHIRAGRSVAGFLFKTPASPLGTGGFIWREKFMSVLIGILITFLVIFLVLYLVQRLPIDGRAKQIVQIIVIIIGIISLLRYLAVF